MLSTIETPPNSVLPAPVLTDVLDAIDAADSSAARVRIAANAMYAMGFDRVEISLRDASLNSTLSVTAGEAVPGIVGHAMQTLPGAVWRRRLPQLERFRVNELFLLDGSDAWVAREFFAVEPSARGDGLTWLPTDLIVGLLVGMQQEKLGIVKLAVPRDGRRPPEAKRREIASLIRHLSSRLAYDVLQSLAQRRASRLQRLQEAGAAMARSLDEHEIMRELARQALRATGAEGVSVGQPDLDQDLLTTPLCIVRGSERPRSVVRLGEGIVSEVARTGRPVRVGDREADRAREKAGLAPPLSTYDVVGDSGPAASMLAVPLLAGIQLMGVLSVHASSSEVFSAEDEEVLATMASQAATAIANARRYAVSERERRQTEALADVARAVGESLRLGEVLRLILRHSVALLGVEGACIALRQDDYVHIVAGVGSADVLAGVHLPLATSLLGASILEHTLVVSNDFASDSRSSQAVLRLAQIQRTAIAPLMTASGTIGAIAVINREQPFTDDDARVLQRLSDHVAVAIVNARLFEELERATREWKVAFDAIVSGMVVLDDALSVKRCNARAAELCASAISELLGKPFAPMLVGIAEGQVESIGRLIQRSITDGRPVREVVRDDAGGHLYEFLVAPHPDGGCVVTFDDVTEGHRLAERHQRVLETVTDAIVITGLDGRIAFANAAANTLFRSELLQGQDIESLTVPSSWGEVHRRERAAHKGTPQRYECHIVRADGEHRLVAVSNAALFELGQVTGTVSSLRDVTEQRAGAEALARSEANYTRLVESASDAIFTVSSEGSLTSGNRGLASATGRQQHELIGLPYVQLFDPRDRDLAAKLFTRTLSGDGQRRALRYTGPQGAVRIGMLTTAPIMEAGVAVGGLGIMHDISDDELLRESSAQQSRLANAGDLLHAVANELNNPLSSLLALTDLELMSSTMASVDRAAMSEIATEAQRVARVLNQLLEAAGDDGPTDRVLDVDRTVNRAIELHGFARPSGGTFIGTTLQGALPAVLANPQQLQQILISLLANADDAVVDSSNDMHIHVSTRQDGQRVLIEVSDTGLGIAPSDLSRVFEPTFTTHGARGRRGYGLTIARQIAQAHGGEITVRSTLGEGTTFTVSLAAVIDTSEATVAPTVSTPSKSERAVEPSTSAVADGADATARSATDHIRKPSLLLVEDEVTLRTAISRYLVRQGYAVETAECGADALHMLAARSFDLILLDLRLPDMGGDEVYGQLMERSPSVAGQVVFMTGDLSRPSAAEFVHRTGAPVIAKPFQLAELDALISRVLHRA